MLHFPNIDPVVLSLGPVKVYWYGLMYIIGFGGGWALGIFRAKRPGSGWTVEEVADLIFYSALGVILGGRIGYMLFYRLSDFVSDPSILFRIWEGGMAFHGGLIGAIISFIIFSRKFHKSFFAVGDFIAPMVPIGLAAGRVGNFINGELWGRVTDMPWGMVFPNGGPFARHPSEIYEFLLEGVLLFLILWIYSEKPRPRGAVSGLFLLCYGIFRSFAEYFRQPDSHLGFVAFDWLTMGQLLSIPMIIAGIVILYYAHHRKIPDDPEINNDSKPEDHRKIHRYHP